MGVTQPCTVPVQGPDKSLGTFKKTFPSLIVFARPGKRFPPPLSASRNIFAGPGTCSAFPHFSKYGWECGRCVGCPSMALPEAKRAAPHSDETVSGLDFSGLGWDDPCPRGGCCETGFPVRW